MRTRILTLALVFLLIGIAGPAPAQAPAQPTNAGPVLHVERVLFCTNPDPRHRHFDVLRHDGVKI
jgi:hypothetical protein